MRPAGTPAGHRPPPWRGTAHDRLLDLASRQITYRIRQGQRW